MCYFKGFQRLKNFKKILLKGRNLFLHLVTIFYHLNQNVMKKILVQFNFPNMPAAKYEQVWADLRAAGHTNPKGLIYHVGAPNGNDWTVVDVWESEAAFTKFGEVLMPILAKNDVPEGRPSVQPVHYEYTGTVSAVR
jgi:hypothetical protein